MKYRDLYITGEETNDVPRFNDKGSVTCDGIWFRVYADSGYQIEMDDFKAAYGFDMERSEESVEKFLAEHIDKFYEEYKEQQFRMLLEKDYKDYIYDVKQFDEDFNIIEDAEMIANMKRAYECIKDFKGITLEEMEYLVTIKRPLESICDQFVLDKNSFIEDFSKCVKQAAKDEVCSYGMVEDDEDRDEKIIGEPEPECNAEMTMS